MFLKHQIRRKEKKTLKWSQSGQTLKPSNESPSTVVTAQMQRRSEVSSADISSPQTETRFSLFPVCVVHAWTQRPSGPIAKWRASAAERVENGGASDGASACRLVCCIEHKTAGNDQRGLAKPTAHVLFLFFCWGGDVPAGCRLSAGGHPGDVLTGAAQWTWHTHTHTHAGTGMNKASGWLTVAGSLQD